MLIVKIKYIKIFFKEEFYGEKAITKFDGVCLVCCFHSWKHDLADKLETGNHELKSSNDVEGQRNS